MKSRRACAGRGLDAQGDITSAAGVLGSGSEVRSEGSDPRDDASPRGATRDDASPSCLRGGRREFFGLGVIGLGLWGRRVEWFQNFVDRGLVRETKVSFMVRPQGHTMKTHISPDSGSCPLLHRLNKIW